jgi:CubicO group peptidase (beta-lactamase class C family)
MRSGIRISKEQNEEFDKNPAQLRGKGQVQAFLEHSAPITIESQSFLYQDDPMWVMQVIDEVVPGTAKEFSKNEFLDKMDITNYGWGTDVSGLPAAGWKSSITSRDMVKLGILAMNKGKWNGEQLIPEAFIAKATNKIVNLKDDQAFFVGDKVSEPGYGYFWWQANMKTGSKTYFTTSAQGGGGQHIIVIEELDLIVVITGHMAEVNIMQMTAQRIIPAFTKQ